MFRQTFFKGTQGTQCLKPLLLNKMINKLDLNHHLVS